MRPDVPSVLDKFVQWARVQADIQGLLLVGSYSRGESRPDSDVDLVMLVDQKSAYLNDFSWFTNFGLHQPSLEEWGPVTSLRSRWPSGLELELSLAPLSWASVNPVDPGTARVVQDGAKILYDSKGMLSLLLNSLK